MSTENENENLQDGNAPNEATPNGSQDKSSKPAVAVTKAPNAATGEDGRTVEHEVDTDRQGDEDAGPIDVDAVLTDDSSSDDGPPEPPA